MAVSEENFIEEFSESLYNNKGVYFIGSGISQGSDLPDWKNLIIQFVKDIGIDNVDDNDDLPLLGQYYINNHSKDLLFKKIKEDFSNKEINHYHQILNKTNLRSIWTTNYDDLLEKTFPDNYAVKVRECEAFNFGDSTEEVEIIKIHGSICGEIEDLVIAQADYEDFFINKPALVQRLKVELLQNMFVFIGYNYGDPNIQNLLIEVRRLRSTEYKLKHYILLKDKPGDIKFKLWCENLERYNIYPVLYETHEKLPEILTKISLKARGKSVFVTGSHIAGNEDGFRELSDLFIEKDIILINGQSQGVMEKVFTSFTTLCTKQKIDYRSKIKLFANPYAANPTYADNIDLLPNLKEFRKPLMKATRVVVAFDGSMGTCAELDVAMEMGCVIIPYFKEKSLKTWEYLEKIHYSNPEYLEKIKSKTVKISDLIEELKSNLN